MTWITRPGLGVSIAVLLSFFATAHALAQQCDFSGNCPLPLTCQPGFLGGHCAIQYCNADTDCRNGSACSFGTCQLVCNVSRDCPGGQICVPGETHRICSPPPAPGGGNNNGAPTRYYVEGGLCGTIRYGQITKHLGCAPGLRCSNPNGRGLCQKLPP